LGNYREYMKRRQQQQQQQQSSSPFSAQSMFFYSASTQKELVFAEELLQLFNLQQQQHDRMVFTLTQSDEWDRNSLVQKLGNIRDGDGDGDPDADLNGVLERIELNTGRYLKPFLDEAPTDALFFFAGLPPSTTKL